MRVHPRSQSQATAALTPRAGATVMKGESMSKFETWTRTLAVLATLVAAGTALPTPARAVTSTCNTFIAIGLSTPFNAMKVNDVATVTLTLGTGGIQNGTKVTINRLRYELDCVAPSFVGCADQGAIFEYEGDGTITTDCSGISWSSNVPAGGSATNEIVLSPSPGLMINAGNSAFCSVSFGVKLLSLEPTAGPTSDATPTAVEVNAGFLGAPQNDAVCDNGLASGGTQPGSISICPTCTGDACTTSVCNQDTGVCDTTPLVSTACTDTDGNNCTTAGCEADPADATHGVCVQTHQTQTCTGDACTSAVCNTSTGACDFTPLVSTACADTDGNNCTTAGCEAGGPMNHGSCVQTHQTQT